MKKFIFMAMMALLAGCSDRELTDDVAEAKSAETVQTSEDMVRINALVEKARWGDAQAFLQLADCYKDGIGVKKDFLNMMCMAEQATEFGAFNNMNDYFDNVPDDNAFKQCAGMVNLDRSDLKEGKDSLLAKLGALEDPDALAMCGIIYMESGDTIGGLGKIRQAADNGSNFASAVWAMMGSDGKLRYDTDMLERIADKNPIAYRLLGKIYREKEEDSDINKSRVARYYMEAEKHALLTRREAGWVLAYYRNGGDIQLTDEDVKRLKAFSCIPDDELEFITDSVCADSID